MNTITCSEYWSQVNDLAVDLLDECLEECNGDIEDARDLVFDSRLHETIDGHQWVIYTYYNQFILLHSENTEYGLDNGLIEWVAGKSCYSELTGAMAFWALYADVSEKLSDLVEERECA